MRWRENPSGEVEMFSELIISSENFLAIPFTGRVHARGDAVREVSHYLVCCFIEVERGVLFVQGELGTNSEDDA